MNIPIEIAAVFITAFLAIISFGFKIIWENTKAINGLSSALSQFKQKSEDSEKFDKKTHEVIDQRLNEYSSKLQAHKEILIENDVKLKEILK